jgi:hypothetical protein
MQVTRTHKPPGSLDAALSWQTLIKWARASTKMEIWLKGGEHRATLAMDAWEGLATNPDLCHRFQCIPPKMLFLPSSTELTASLSRTMVDGR